MQEIQERLAHAIIKVKNLESQNQHQIMQNHELVRDIFRKLIFVFVWLTLVDSQT
jgi:hypothetical protein